MNVGLHTRLKPGAEAEYDRLHEAVWPEILEAIRAAGVTKWRIYRDGLDLLHHIECEDYERAIAELAELEVNQRWQATVAPLMEVAHDYSGAGADRVPLIFALDAVS
jgi:L-rhamnose mutarotase